MGTQARPRGWRVGHATGASDGGTVHRGRLLEVDADTAARGVLERLLGLFGENVVLETENGDQSGIDTVRAQACQRGADAKANTIGRRRTRGGKSLSP